MLAQPHEITSAYSILITITKVISIDRMKTDRSNLHKVLAVSLIHSLREKQSGEGIAKRSS